MTKLIRIESVCELTGLSRATIYRLMKSNEFPPPERVSRRCVRWLETDIENWILMRRNFSNQEEA